jgi:transcriptional regulator with XRE-family HTH domain
MTDFLDTWAKENDEHARLIAEERLITEVTEALWDTMQQAGISKSELASRLGKSKGHISQLFSGSRNMTLRTLAEICSALDCVPSFSVSARCAGKRLKRLRSH